MARLGKPDASRPEVTTIIPTRDRKDWLPRALLSALGQEGIEAETLLVDCGSRTPLGSWFRADGCRLRVLRQETPGGPPAARNTGLADARGKWVAFLDDDDIWAPVKLRTQLRAAAETGADFVFCGGVE